ncbi:hypothetical protein OIU34_01040 [Pararhizobium sp. BT-229]|uniref:hypothetical protein n=1 Tax=Pararhizobium sp. BT-229 TaxID=2986923 RepID=UPI0021F79EC0|nr:hypothetical protein [Pararhizobium sp. BT-229]MCV9960469.1 hypothetical protein [Pararhizobium sp. BT-229]
MRPNPALAVNQRASDEGHPPCCSRTLADSKHRKVEDPVVGSRKTELRDTTAIASSAHGYCIIVKSDTHNGKQMGTFSGGNSYSGNITDSRFHRHKAAQVHTEREL